MKKLGLLALLLATAPLAATAQFVIFTDNFTSSTTNQNSIPGGTPFSSFTSYEVLSSKDGRPTSINTTNHQFTIRLAAGTSSGLIETEAVFTRNPITLVNVGDSITLSYTFKMTNAFLTTSGYIGQGLYNSGGTLPVSGGALANAGMGTANFVTGNAQLWQGIFSRWFSNATSGAFVRPPQTNNPTTSDSQDLLSPSSVTGGFQNPAAVALSGTLPAQNIGFDPAQFYNMSMTIAIGDTNTEAGTQFLNITNTLSDSQGNVLVTFASTATDVNYMTTFDSLALGRREVGGTVVPVITMVITNITVTANLSTLPGQPFNVTGGGQGCPGGTFPVGLNGSVATNDYYLYTNGVWNGTVKTGTGAALSFGNETVISVPLTNTVFASNTVSGSTGFMLGSAVVAPNPPPSISSQPIPMIVANGSIAVFSVTATGGGLTYQWYKGGVALSDGGRISGSTNTTLVITSVAPGDAANYYAVITSGCGAQLATATNALTVQPAASIVWQGNNPNSNWDLSTTANFTNGSTPVVFHNGDYVTLDDTALTPIINIANNYLSPSGVTNNGFNNFILSGSGVIQGPGTFVMNGPGTTSINNSNAFLGGTIVNGGILITSNMYSLGQSTINLTGGTLQMEQSFGSAAGLTNNINVAGNATLQIDKAGTFGTVLTGMLTGDPAATLTVNLVNAGTTTARIRMYGDFTNNAAIVLNSTGDEIEFAPYNATNDLGNQVYNGVISGGGGHIVPRGAGNVIFNNTNTITDNQNLYTGVLGYSLLLSSGNVGLGADSVSTTPGVIDASPVGKGTLGINTTSEFGTSVLFASGGAHTIGNLMAYTTATNTVTLVLGGTNKLTFSGEFDLANPDNTGVVPPLPTDTTGTNRTIQVTNTAPTIFSGLITDYGHSSGITKTGNGILYLNGSSTNSGPTFVAGGVLAGSGTTLSAVDVQTNGLIGGGPDTAIGTFTINNTLTFDGGGAYIRINKSLSPAQSNDVVSVSGAITANAVNGSGTIVVTNAGPAINVGDKFKIFNKAVGGTGTFNIIGAGVTWNNNLAVDGSISVSSLSSSQSTNPTNITVSASGTNLFFSWPLDHLGWYLQVNTNVTSNTWRTIFGTQLHTNNTAVITTNQPNQFYRMSLNP
jgi:autotransporter-associated beta strand protein